MTRIVPLHNNIVVEEFQLGEVTKGGILLPQVAKASTPYRYAKVVEVGPGRYAADGRLIPTSVEVGAIVAFAKNQGVEFPLEDEDGEEKVFRLLNEQFVLGIMKDMPEQSRLTGLDGKLMMMTPGSRARSDGALKALDDLARAKHEGFLDTSGTMLEDMEAADMAEAQAEGE